MPNRKEAMFKGVHHVGLSVSNIERSFEFYERLLGRLRDFSTESEGPELSKAVGVPNAQLRFGFITLGSIHLELLEYRNERRDRYELANCDVGATHVCFEVVDLAEAMTALAEDGIAFYSPPLHIEEGPLAGYSFVYFDDPDGITLELFQHRTGAELAETPV
ncbi:MAG: VOC family protein [Acidimicrobiales bacterium]